MFSATYKLRLATAMVGAALALVLVVSSASASYGSPDRRSPDVVDAASATPQDRRSPDVVDAASATPQVPPAPSSIAAPAAEEYQDLRSVDTRDQAEGNGPTSEPQPVLNEPSGFDLVSAAIGAVAAAGLSLVLMAAISLRRPARRRPANA